MLLGRVSNLVATSWYTCNSVAASTTRGIGMSTTTPD